MTMLQALLLGALQGLTEFLPVSSSGHLVIMRVFFGVQDPPVLFDVLLHVSTLFVVLLVFRRRIGEIVASLYRRVRKQHQADDEENIRLFLLVLCASAVTAVLGFGLSFVIETVRASHRVVSVFFFVTGLILISTLFTSGNKGYRRMSYWDALMVGFAQGLGVLPGISRSGITISACLVRDLDKRKAAEFSFLIFIPAIVGALALELREFESLFVQIDAAAIAVGCVVSFLVGLVSLFGLLAVLKRGRMYIFSIYLLPLAILTFILF